MTVSPDKAAQEALPAPIRLLQWLVIGLTASLILGVIIVVAVVVTRFPRSSAAVPTVVPVWPESPAWPETLELPDGVVPEAVTLGRDWIGVVTGDDRFLIYDRASGALRQTVILTRP